MMEFDAFISYSSKDKTAADAACAVLERTGVRCWIAPRDIRPGVEYGAAIIPVRIEDVAPTKSMEYFLGAIHWLDALTPPLEGHLHKLAETAKAILQVDAAGGGRTTSRHSTRAQPRPLRN